MTLQEIVASRRETLTPADVAPVLGVDPQNIRNQMQINPASLRFPAALNELELPDTGKEYLIGYAEGLAAMAQKNDNRLSEISARHDERIFFYPKSSETRTRTCLRTVAP